MMSLVYVDNSSRNEKEGPEINVQLSVEASSASRVPVSVSSRSLAPISFQQIIMGQHISIQE